MTFDKLTIVVEYRGTSGTGVFTKPMLAVRVEEVPDSEEMIFDLDGAFDLAKQMAWDAWADSLPEKEPEDDEG